MPAPTSCCTSSIKVAGLLGVLHHGPDPFLKFPAELAARHHAGQVDGNQLLSSQGGGGLGAGHQLGQAFGHGALADAGLADQDRVILGAAGENLHHPLRFPLPADYRVQFAVFRRLGQVPSVAQIGRPVVLLAFAVLLHGGAELQPHRGLGLGLGLRRHHGPLQLVRVAAHPRQNPNGGAIRLRQHGAPELIAGHQGLAALVGRQHRVLHDGLEVRAQFQAGGSGFPFPGHLAHGIVHVVHVHRFRQPGHDAPGHGQQGQEQMLRPDEGVAETDRRLPGNIHHALGAVIKTTKYRHRTSR